MEKQKNIFACIKIKHEDYEKLKVISNDTGMKIYGIINNLLKKVNVESMLNNK